MNRLLKFFYKLALFAAIAALSQILLARFVLPADPEIASLNRFLAEKYDVIYFGDSVLNSSPGSDTDRSTIPQMLSRLNPGLKIANYSHGADNLDMYALYAEYISRSAEKPKALIVPINIRSFSVGWDLDPAGQFEKLKFYLTAEFPFLRDFYHPLAVMNAIEVNEVPKRVFLETPVLYGTTTVGTAADFDPEIHIHEPTAENIRDVYVYEYMSNLNPNHRKLASLRRLIGAAKAGGIALYVYITPIDYQGGLKAVGTDFLKQTRANAAVACAAVREKNLPCLNLAFDLSSDYFSHPQYPDEHLRDKGRAFIADKLNAFFFKPK